MQLTNEWIEQGKVEGRQEGRQEGRIEGSIRGRRELLLRLFRRRFSSMPATLSKQIGVLSDSQLDALGEALLDFKNIADARTWLREQLTAN
jgi:predicted transposase YdaD